VGGKAESACECDPGWHGPNSGPCERCAPGTHKSVAGSAPCVPATTMQCPPGSYAAAQSSCVMCSTRPWKSCINNHTACLACPAGLGKGLVGAKAESACVCDPGWHGPNCGPCERCALGTHKSAAGSAPCVPATTMRCPPGSYAATQSSCVMCSELHWKSCINNRTACLACPAGSGGGLVGGKTKSACVCDPGWHGADGGPCARCASGSYKLVAGSAPCVPVTTIQCPTGKHRARDTNTCLPCPANTWKIGTNNATACSHVHHEVLKHSCSLTALGAADPVLCSDCSAGTYSGLGVLACAECLAGTYSAESDTTSNTSCLSCEPGTYAQSTRASAGCALCPTDTFSPATQADNNTTCTQCSATQVSASGASECVTCPPGTYKRAGSVVCSPCEVTHFCSGGAVTRCDANSQTSPHDHMDARAAGDCFCNPGYSH